MASTIAVLLFEDEAKAPVQEPQTEAQEVEVVLEAIPGPDGWVIDNFCVMATVSSAEIEIVRPLARGEVHWARSERCPYHGFSLGQTQGGSVVLVAERPEKAQGKAKKHSSLSRGKDPRRVDHGHGRI